MSLQAYERTDKDITPQEKFQRYVHTGSLNGTFISDLSGQHNRFAAFFIVQFLKTSTADSLLKLVLVANDQPLISQKILIAIVAASLNLEVVPNDVKQKIKEELFTFLKSDEDFFYFVRMYTTYNMKHKKKVTTCLKKIVNKFYNSKSPDELAQCFAKQESYHGWSHKELIKLCHYKPTNEACTPIIKYALFGVEELPEEGQAENKSSIEFLKKVHQLRTTVDVKEAVTLLEELHFTTDQANSKLNKKEEIWMASIPTLTTREILQCLYRFYKFGFLKTGSPFQGKLVEMLTNAEKNKQCHLHPLEVYIYLKFFEKGGKPLDLKLLEYLKKKEIKEESLKKITTPNEPKCKSVLQNISKCMKLSYDNVQPTGKKFMITIDVTDKIEDSCFQSKGIGFLEAAVAITRCISKVEKGITVAVFKDNQINFVDISKANTAVEKLQEHKSNYIMPTTPIEWARNKKKKVDVFINFMSCNWLTHIPQDMKEKLPKLPEALSKYSQKMKTPNTRVVKFFLGGPSGAYLENAKNILSIGGFSVEVPRVLEAFCREQFC